MLGEARSDNLTGEAAKVAYYFFLSLWPLLLGVLAFTGLVGGEPAFAWIMNWLEAVVPGDLATLLARFVREITADERPDMLSLGIVLTLWSGSGIFAALADGLNVICDVTEGRPWWRKRLVALGMLVGASLLLTGGAAAILAGGSIISSLGLGAAWNVARWPVAFLLLVVLAGLLYVFLPNRTPRFAGRPLAIGALVGALLWVLVTSGFRLYVAHWGSYSQTYGFVGAIIVLLLWLYLTALALLFGGEVAASLEQGIHRRART
ncbi:MAG: YihY/virulence factor BrkB family protein [Gemmatimonadota bacterium]